MTNRQALLDVYDRLLERYGPQHWWPAETRFEMMVGAVLTQAVSWDNVEKAISNLKAADALSPQAIRQLPHDDLARLVYPAGYYNAKARKLKALSEYLGDRYDDDPETMAGVELGALRAELLEVHGIGEETADDILLYAAGKPAFVIDSHTQRLFFRLGLGPERGTYAGYQALFESRLPADAELFGEYHALIDHHASTVCKKTPLCHGCCLVEICPTGGEVVRSSPTLPESRDG